MNHLSCLAMTVLVLILPIASSHQLPFSFGGDVRASVHKYLKTVIYSYQSKSYAKVQVAFKLKSRVEFKWPCVYAPELFKLKGLYDESPAIFTGVFKYGEQTFVTLSSKSGKVPASLYKVVDQTQLEPYPSLSLNDPGNCSCLQSAGTTVVDPRSDAMYVVDNGASRPGLGSGPAQGGSSQKCAPKLMVFNTRQGGALQASFELKPGFSYSDSYFSAIALDYGDSKSSSLRYAYLVDVGLGRIVVFDFNLKGPYYFIDDSMNAGGNQSDDQLISALVIDKDCQYVYYSCRGSLELHRVSTSTLRDPSSSFSQNSTALCTKISPSDTMVIGSKGIYYLANGTCDLYRLDMPADQDTLIAPDQQCNHTVIYRDPEDDCRSQGLSLNSQGELYFMAGTPGSDGTVDDWRTVRFSVEDPVELTTSSPAP